MRSFHIDRIKNGPMVPTGEGFSHMFPLGNEGKFAGEVAKPGKYKVVIADSLAAMERNTAYVNKTIPTNCSAKFKEASTSDLTVNIDPGPNTLTIELKD